MTKLIEVGSWFGRPAMPQNLSQGELVERHPSAGPESTLSKMEEFRDRIQKPAAGE